MDKAPGDTVGIGAEEPAAQRDRFGKGNDRPNFAACGADSSEQRGFVGAGCDDVDVDGNFGSVELHGYGFAHSYSCGFGSPVGKKLRVAIAGATAGEEYNFAAMRWSVKRSVEPGLNETSGDEKRAGGINAQGMGKLFGIELPKIAGLAKFGGRVDYDVEALPFAVDFGVKRGDGIWVSNIDARSAVSGAELRGGSPDLFPGSR